MQEILQNYMTEDCPKVLILGETFRRDTGGGITLINLFHFYPKERIAVVSDQSRFSITEYPAKYYQLGKKEKNRFLSFYTKSTVKSGIIIPTGSERLPFTSKHSGSKSKSYFGGTIKMYLNIVLSKFKNSNELYSFIQDFQPDILYIQPNSYGYVTLANELVKKHKFQKILVHFMDDFKFYISQNHNFFINQLFNKHFSKLKILINKSNTCFGISPKMCDEYSQLFNKIFYCFHNPVDIDLWNKKSFCYETNIHNPIKLIYSGRIGIANYTSIIETIEAIEKLNIQSTRIYLFEIYSPDRPTELMEKIIHSKFVTHFGYKTQTDIQNALASAQIVLLPLSFDETAYKRIYLSMPTKTAECLACPCAILIYAPPLTALTEYALLEDFGYVVKEQGVNNIIQGLVFLSKESRRLEFIKTAGDLAKSKHSLSIVAQNFKEKLLA